MARAWRGRRCIFSGRTVADRRRMATAFNSSSSGVDLAFSLAGLILVRYSLRPRRLRWAPEEDSCEGGLSSSWGAALMVLHHRRPCRRLPASSGMLADKD